MPAKRRKLNNKEEHRSGSPSQESSQSLAAAPPPPSPQPSVHAFTIPFPGKAGKTIACERRGSTAGPPCLVFTHGAGGGLDGAAMVDFGVGFAAAAPLVSFQGTMHMPSRLRAFRAVMAHEQCGELVGGRSMGARAAAMLATDADGGEDEAETRPARGVEALVLVSFPLVTAKGDRREDVLMAIGETVDVLMISGDRDSMCDLQDLNAVAGRMQCRVWVLTVEGADHGMALRKKDEGGKEVRERTGRVAADWWKARDDGNRFRRVGWSADESEVADTGWIVEEAEGSDEGKEAEVKT